MGIIRRPPGRRPASQIRNFSRILFYTLRFWKDPFFFLIGIIFLIFSYKANQVEAGIFLILVITAIYLLQRE